MGYIPLTQITWQQKAVGHSLWNCKLKKEVNSVLHLQGTWKTPTPSGGFEPNSHLADLRKIGGFESKWQSADLEAKSANLRQTRSHEIEEE
jgi:hypothetical protein